ncbi:MAG: DUF975 family protein [Peptostreptococcaceae bacterium]
MWERAYLKELAKTNFKKSYKQTVIVCLIVYVIGTVFDGGYNSANNYANNKISYNQTVYIEDSTIYNTQEHISNDEFNLGNKIIENENTIVNITSNGIIATFFLSLFNAINSMISGLSLAVFGFVMIGIMLVASLLRVVILNPVKIGKNNFFMGIRQEKRNIGDVFFLFHKSKFIKPGITMFFMDIFIFLWSLLLVIPGIIKSYEYRMIPYILSENPEIDRRRAFELSRHMMYEQKWNVFILDLSFIGWNILSSITLGLLGIFYVNPYIESTYAELYAVLRDEAIQSNFTNDIELPGFDLKSGL